MKKILLSIMIIAVVIAVAAGGTMAYFSVTSNINNNITTAQLSMTTTPASGQFAFNAANVVPGWSEAKTISVTNNSSVPLQLYADFTLAASCNEALAKALTVKINDTSVGNAWEVANAPLYKSIVVQPGQTESIIVTVSLPDTGASQNELMGKYFGGTLTIEGRAPAQ
jgi:predicted ribosomally synthesized peptide with SipW-like signal peptide